MEKLWNQWRGGFFDWNLKNEFQGEVAELASHVIFIHSIVHRQAIAAKKLKPEAHEVLQD